MNDTSKNYNSDIPFLLYGDGDQKPHVKVRIKNETIWLTQKSMSELFDTSTDNISLHLRNIYNEEELFEVLTTEEISVVQNEAGRNVQRKLKFYNLDAIIAVGYRVNSKKATKFRIWTTHVLKEFIQKGFVLDDKRLKQGEITFEQDYFRELLERVRSIRTSERRLYQKITDIFAECTADYDPKSNITRIFYASIQNKFHFAITKQTAAEIIYSKADHVKPHMGLTTWKNAQKGRILISDVSVAKNYLTELEIKKLERAVSSFFDYIENILERKILIKMENMTEYLDKFLTFNEYKILPNKGEISKNMADNKALTEYDIFNKTQKIESDFDRFLKQNKRDSKQLKQVPYVMV